MTAYSSRNRINKVHTPGSSLCTSAQCHPVFSLLRNEILGLQRVAKHLLKSREVMAECYQDCDKILFQKLTIYRPQRAICPHLPAPLIHGSLTFPLVGWHSLTGQRFIRLVEEKLKKIGKIFAPVILEILSIENC